MEQWLTAISTVGFPIACCVYLFYSNNKTIEKLRETVDNNTKALIELTTKFKASDED